MAPPLVGALLAAHLRRRRNSGGVMSAREATQPVHASRSSATPQPRAKRAQQAAPLQEIAASAMNSARIADSPASDAQPEIPPIQRQFVWCVIRAGESLADDGASLQTAGEVFLFAGDRFREIVAELLQENFGGFGFRRPVIRIDAQ